LGGHSKRNDAMYRQVGKKIILIANFVAIIIDKINGK